MSLRILAGSAKGQILRGPKNQSIRPAAARVRKSIFDILGRLEDETVLDLFAGTGSIGLECLSRGAKEVTFVDSSPQSIQLLVENLEKTGFRSQAQVIKKPAKVAIRELSQQGLSFDLIFVDPPYDQNHLNPCLEKIAAGNLLKPEGLLLCEHSPREIPKILNGLEKVDERKYGQTLVTIFIKR